MVVFVTNIIPSISKDIFSDGLNAFLFLKNKKSKITYHYQLIIYRQLLLGNRPSELVISEKDILYLRNNINIYSFYPLYTIYLKYIDEEKFFLANELLDLLKKNENMFNDEAKLTLWLERKYVLCLGRCNINLTSKEKNKINELLRSGSIEYIRIYHALCINYYRDEDTAKKYSEAVEKVSPLYMTGLFHFHRDLILKLEKGEYKLTGN